LRSYRGAARFWTNRLVQGETYDFRAYYGGSVHYFENITIESQDIEFGDYTLRLELEGDQAILEFNNIVLPKSFCDEVIGG